MPKLTDRDFQCDNCGGLFTVALSHAEATEQFFREFPGEPLPQGDDLAVLCDDCWHKFNAWWSTQNAD